MKRLTFVGSAATMVAVLGGIPLPARAAEAANQVPEQARRQLQEALGAPFVVFRAKAQDELKLSDEQKTKLDGELLEMVQDAMQFFQKIDGLKGEDREKELKPYRQEARAKLATLLKDTLTDDQGQRLRQLELQQEGPFALLHGEGIGNELKITEEQRKQFRAVVQEMQKKIGPLIKQAQSGGDPREIRPKIMQVRKDHEGKLVALLTDAQKKQWQEMLGKPFDLGD